MKKTTSTTGGNGRNLGFFVRKVVKGHKDEVVNLMDTVRVLRRARGSCIWKYVAAETDGKFSYVISGSSRFELIPWWDRVVCGAMKVEEERDSVERRRLAVLNSNLDVLVGRVSGKISKIERHVRSIVRQIYVGLEEIRSQCGCAHGNLLPSNIVLEPHDEMNEIVRLRLQDFGFDPEIESSTLEFYPPEIVLKKNKESSYSHDIWSCGVLVLTLLGSRLLKRTKTCKNMEIVRSYCTSLNHACSSSSSSSSSSNKENPSLADVWLDEDLRRAITPALCEFVTTSLYVRTVSRNATLPLETKQHKKQDIKPAQFPLKSPAPPLATPLKTKKSDIVDMTTHVEETPLIRVTTPTKKSPVSRSPPSTTTTTSTTNTTLRCEKLENEKSCLRATLEGNVLAPFLPIDMQCASWQELYSLFRDKIPRGFEGGMSRGKNKTYISLASTWDNLLQLNDDSNSKVRRALAALPWSRPILCTACGGSLCSTKKKDSTFLLYASIKSLRPVHVPYSLRRRVWCAFLDVESDEDTVSTFSMMRNRYANLLCRASQLGIDCEEQVTKDVNRCHQYIYLTQTPTMRAAVTRLVKAWIVEGRLGTRGYYQGLSSVCVVFLVLFEMDEAFAFACLRTFLERHLLRPSSVPTRFPRSPSRSPTRSRSPSKDTRSPSKDTRVHTKDISTKETPTKEMMRTPPPKSRIKRMHTKPSQSIEEFQATETKCNNWWDAQDRTLKFRLSKIAKLVGFHDSTLACRLERIELRPDMFGLRYLLSMFAHTLPLRPLFVLWDAILTREHPSYVLCVTAAFIMLQCEFYDDDDNSAHLSTIMHQLSNLTGPKLTIVRRALDVADELWGSTPIDCLTISEENLTIDHDNKVEDVSPSVWTKPLHIPIISALEIEKSVLVCVGPSSSLDSFVKTYESVTIEAEVFRLCLTTCELMCEDVSTSMKKKNNVDEEKIEDKRKFKRKMESLETFLSTHQDRWSSDDNAVPPLVTLIPIVSGLDEDYVVDATVRTEKSCSDLAQRLIRKGVNHVLVTEAFRGGTDNSGNEIVTTNWHTGIVLIELRGVFD